MTTVDPFDAMMGGNFARLAKFDSIGDKHGGVILEVDMVHAREYDEDNPGKGDLLYWSDKGKPRTTVTDKPVMEPRMTIQTDEREDDRDDGRRAIMINKRLLKAALQKGVREAGATKPAIGGYIVFERIEDQPPLKGDNWARGWNVPYRTPEQYATDGALEATVSDAKPAAKAGRKPKEEDPFATA